MQVTKEYILIVEAIYDDKFLAKISDRYEQSTDEMGEFYMNRLPESEREKVVIGSLILWTIKADDNLRMLS